MSVAAVVLSALAVLAAGRAPVADPVRVGAYYFPPFVEDREGPVRGLAAGLLAVLNAAQIEYRFEPVRTTPAGRYADFAAGRFDLIAFEEAAWGWAGRGVAASRVFFEDAEVYVARAAPGRGQDYFGDVARRRLAALRGYHYGFAGFEGDPARLQARFDIHLDDDHGANLRRVLDGRSEVAVVPGAWLRQRLRQDPGLGSQLLVGDRPDQPYRLTILVRAGARPGVAWLDRLLDRLDADGTLGALWRRFGVRP